MSLESSDGPFDIRTLLERNARWVDEQRAGDASYFEEHAKGQQPHTLWIGCADSRVPANLVTGTRVGEIFVHRNVANVVVPEDFNLGSVVQYSVGVLEVDHVVVCGHYGCGGVKASLGHDDLGTISDWLRHVKDVYQDHHDELAAYSNPNDVERRLVELNVLAGVRGLAKMSALQNAWAKRGAPTIHGWVYDLADGGLRDLGISIAGPEGIEEIYRFNPSE
ncbi:MAG: carbonic anhydrase [Polyangiales bacterium]